jgi:hypothetical protein
MAFKFRISYIFVFLFDQFVQNLIYLAYDFCLLHFIWDIALTLYILLLVGPQAGTNLIVNKLYSLMKKMHLIVDF